MAQYATAPNALQFKAERDANAILKADKRKVDWAILDISTCPNDIAQLANAMSEADLAYRQAKAALEDTLSDKVEMPHNKRLIVTTGRPSGNGEAPILYAFVDGSTSKTTRVVSFEQFTNTRK